MTLVRAALLPVLGVVLLGAAQPPANLPRIGYLMTPSLGSAEARLVVDAFRQGLRDHGYVEGQNILIEYRSADGHVERFRDLANQVVREKPTVIVAGTTPAARAVQRVTTTIPVVVAVMGDPVGDGLVASLARPGGNITGLTFLGPELVRKRLQLLKEALPLAVHVVALWHPDAFGERVMRDMLKETESAARTLGIQLQFVSVRGPDEFAAAFSTMMRDRPDAVVGFPSSMLFNERRRLVDLATQHRLPSVWGASEFAELGGLVAYGASISDLLRRAAGHVDKILKGAKAADLPVEQPTKFELVINLRTARAFNLAIPPSLLVRADRVIE